MKTQLAQYDSFDSFVKEWVNERNIQKHIVLIPQFRFLCDRQGNILMDYVARFEQFNNDFQSIQTKLKTNFQLEHVNKSKRHGYRDYYTDESREIVARVYCQDIDKFGYKFDDN